MAYKFKRTMIFKRRIFCYFIVPLLLFCESPTPAVANTNDNLLTNAFKMTRFLLHKCWTQAASHTKDDEDVLQVLGSCLKRRSLLALDRMAELQRFQIIDGIELVKSNNFTNRCVKMKALIGTSLEDWEEQVIEKVLKIFKTHVLKIRLSGTSKVTEGRRRHHHMSVIMFGVMAMTMIAIPMGFQFLAVLGGKALLLAKLALILTSIQGLKKIATSNLGYGLYNAQHANPWQYDRRLEQDGKEALQGFQGHVPDAVVDLLHHPLSPRIQSPDKQF